MVSDISLGSDQRRVTILVLFDLSKAFDTVSHFHLLAKLRKLNFSDSALSWLFSYLSSRSQSIVDEAGLCLDWLPTTAAVPQVSVLGLLLFSLVINDIGDSLRDCDHMIFADDAQIYYQCRPSDVVAYMTLVSHDIQVIADYATANGLTLNIALSKIMII